MISLSEAAKSIAQNKCTIWRAIKAGRLSATKTEVGTFQIDPGELNRVFSQALFNAQITKLKEMAELLHDELAKARNHRDAWRSRIAPPTYRPRFFLMDSVQPKIMVGVDSASVADMITRGNIETMPPRCERMPDLFFAPECGELSDSLAV